MTQPAITVDGLWKQYVLGKAERRSDTFYDFVTESLRAPFRRVRELRGSSDDDERFWALRDVSLEARPGEVTGIIGRNGAGKSTLLKVLSRITPPSRGRAVIRGRIVSLLEVGTGFHPELTGRENIYLNAALLGMSRAEIAGRFDEIVEFAEVQRFIDTPVKRYSSGMYVRLAFAVAAHLEPEVLIIDEVLAVGDADFQNKCLRRLRDSGSRGEAVVLVSHNLTLVKQLCQHIVWLDRGAVKAAGEPADVLAQYLATTRSTSPRWLSRSGDNEPFVYESVEVVAPSGNTPETISAAASFHIELRFRVMTDTLRGRVAIQLRDSSDNVVFGSACTDGTGVNHVSWRRGQHRYRCEIPGHLLAPGTYFVTVSQPTHSGDRILTDICAFTIDAADSLVAVDGRTGYLAPMLTWCLS
jgi:lipopolysaccharide transport system ATP-binding protein